MTSKEADEQFGRYAKSIGKGVPSELLSEIIEFSSDASRRDWFAKRNTVPFWYERFDKDGLTQKLSILADVWVEVSKSNMVAGIPTDLTTSKCEDNIRRAAHHVDRAQKPANKELVLAFGVYKFKQYTKWELVPHPARYNRSSGTQTMICVALEDLSPSNGFPFELQCGQDVCIDGGADLFLPPTGGGMAVLIWIDL
ncbi:hypothetical protein M409DRAFT_30570 [Zasmidium cellare ATCC 36951]|uniref:Uncharacterized protein n=1 Tax=Zasmidium cellare ATCC 36951 TaxID=1080233 RepID=A0A6A6BZG4_ZASCE|nr:uncharacterized protein M409DRAFT_30570 [Zasmidium cellare ATCC 36951]KAF2158939.1 hypothetical protein M409DRAFT_30570 [Zasmidium cellare ATCC 36951]